MASEGLRLSPERVFAASDHLRRAIGEDLPALGRNFPMVNPQIRPGNRCAEETDLQVAELQAMIAEFAVGYSEKFGTSFPDKLDEAAKECRRADDDSFLSFF